MGGGGATHGLDAALEAFALDEFPMVKPALGFLGWATDESSSRASRVRQQMDNRIEWLGSLQPSAGLAQQREWLAACDVLYVAGGDTARLLNGLRATGLVDELTGALARGLMIVGVSAGASVWFEAALSDAGGQGLRLLRGLGLFPGSFCPHYSNEVGRRSAFEEATASAKLPAGFGVDDGAALRWRQDGSQRTFSARPDARVWRVSAEAGSRPCWM